MINGNDDAHTKTVNIAAAAALPLARLETAAATGSMTPFTCGNRVPWPDSARASPQTEMPFRYETYAAAAVRQGRGRPRLISVRFPPIEDIILRLP